MRSLAFLVLSSALVQNIRAIPVADNINQVIIMLANIIVIKGIIALIFVNNHNHKDQLIIIILLTHTITMKETRGILN